MTDARTQDSQAACANLTLAISGYFRSGASSIPTMLEDWLRFIGGRPAEIVYVDGGSPRRTVNILTGLLERGMIDRLELITPGHWENSYDRCYIQEYRAGLLAQRPYVMFVKLDMLTHRRGFDDWLSRDMRTLDRPGVFAITNTHLIEPAHGREDEYLTSDFASLNFALMKRTAWQEAMNAQIGDFIDSGFRAEFPASLTDALGVEPRFRRALIEWVWQSHCRAHGLRTLGRAESRDWMIYHVNKSGRKLLGLRKRFLKCDGIDAYFDVPKMLYRPPARSLSRIGKSLENALRSIRGRPSPR